MARTTAHWAEPHVVEDILAAARRPGAAEPTEIRVRRALHARLLREVRGPVAVDAQVVVDESERITALDGIRLVVDEDLPAFPGFEIHRAGGPTHGVAAGAADARSASGLVA